jgi:hypothetical protein
MDFTEISVFAERAELNRQLRDASRGVEVGELRRQRRNKAHEARRQRFGTALTKLGAAVRRSGGLQAAGLDTGMCRPKSL